MSEITDIFRTYGHSYRDQFGQRMPPSHRRTIQDINDCRTEVMGGHVFACNHCKQLRYAYHSCKNRSCPTCHEADRKVWLEKRQQERLPVPYFHAVFTLPKELHEIIRSNQKTGYALIMEAAALSLTKLAADSRYVGGQIGMLAILHTWTRALVYHPHVHCLIPAGGLSSDHRYWMEARKNYLVPVKALSEIFRATFMALIRKKLPHVFFPRSLWEKSWVVYCKSGNHTADKTLAYLARYVHQTAITNSRILNTEQSKITFRYKDSREHQWKTMTLDASEFMRRFLQHVLPRGFHKVRYYGLLSPRNRQRLDQIRRTLNQNSPAPGQQTQEPPKDKSNPYFQLCPFCQTGHLIPIMVLPRQGRGPP